MRRRLSRSDKSEMSETDLEGFSLEFEKLQRKYRIMEGDRHAYILEAQEQIRRQLLEIDMLKSEKKEHLMNLSVADSKTNQRRDISNLENITKLLHLSDVSEKALEQERDAQEELDADIKRVEARTLDLRKKVGGAEVVDGVSLRSEKRRRILESRLQRALGQFDSTLTRNSHLRDEIESMRIEKSKFQATYKRSDKEMKELKADIGQIVEASTFAYDQRDDALNKIYLLKEKASKDIKLFNAEIKELQRIVDNDKKLRDFMNSKGITRSMSSAASRKDMTKEGEASIESYEAAFTQIEELSGRQDLTDIVDNFIRVEDHNFALFNYVNEQNNEMEQLNDSIQEIKQEIVKFRDEGSQLESERKKILKQLDCERQHSAEKCKESETLLKSVQKILEQLKLGIGSLFKRIGCDADLMADLLGSDDGVTNENMMQYLGLIEQKANELLTAQSFLDSQDYEKPYDPHETARIILGQVPFEPVKPLLVQVPSTGDLRLRAQQNKLIASALKNSEDGEVDEDSRSDEESRPFSPEELKQRIMKGVIKKEAAAAKADFRYDLTSKN